MIKELKFKKSSFFVALIGQNEKSPISREKIKIGGGYEFSKDTTFKRRV